MTLASARMKHDLKRYMYTHLCTLKIQQIKTFKGKFNHRKTSSLKNRPDLMSDLDSAKEKTEGKNFFRFKYLFFAML